MKQHFVVFCGYNRYWNLVFSVHKEQLQLRVTLLVSSDLWFAKWFTALCCMWHRQSWVWTPTKTCGHMICKFMDQKGLTAMVTSKQSAGVARSECEDHYRWESMQAREPPWLWNPGQASSEIQNRVISASTKRTCVLQTFLKNLLFTWLKWDVKHLAKIC